MRSCAASGLQHSLHAASVSSRSSRDLCTYSASEALSISDASSSTVLCRTDLTFCACISRRSSPPLTPTVVGTSLPLNFPVSAWSETETFKSRSAAPPAGDDVNVTSSRDDDFSKMAGVVRTTGFVVCSFGALQPASVGTLSGVCCAVVGGPGRWVVAPELAVEWSSVEEEALLKTPDSSRELCWLRGLTSFDDCGAAAPSGDCLATTSTLLRM